MRKLVNMLLVILLLILVTSCTSDTQKQPLKEYCYVGEELYYTVEHSYQNDLKIKSVVEYADNFQQDVYLYEYDQNGNKVQESVYSAEQLVYTLTFEYIDDLCVKQVRQGQDKQNNYTLIYEYTDSLKTKMTYLDSDNNEYYYCIYKYDENDNLISEKYYEQKQLVSQIEYKLIYKNNKISSQLKYANGNLVSQTDFEYDEKGNTTYQNMLNLEQNIEYKEYSEYDGDLLVKSKHYEGDQLSGYVVYEYK